MILFTFTLVAKVLVVLPAVGTVVVPAASPELALAEAVPLT